MSEPTDLLNRRYTAEQMIRMFASQQEGFVVAVDAPWGDGKTFFASMFVNVLQEEYNAAPIFIDAFEHDYTEDPFMVLASAVYAKISKDKTLRIKAKAFLAAAINVGKRLLPIATEYSLKIFTDGIIGGKHIEDIKSAISGGGAKITETLLEERLTNYAKQQENTHNFKIALAEFAKNHCVRTKTEDFPDGLPLIIFVDELDRCNPTFAVRMLERIKHFFDIDNIIFVLLVNKQQIFEAIRGVYGREIDASHYFEKFVNYSCTLNGINSNGQRPSLIYCQKYMSLLNGNIATAQKIFIQKFCELMQYITSRNREISLRDIEKIFGYVSRSDNAIWDFGTLWSFLATVKVKYPLEYIAFVEKDYDGMYDIIRRLFPGLNDSEYPRSILVAAISLHCRRELTDEQRHLALGSFSRDIIPFLTSRMDCKQD